MEYSIDQLAKWPIFLSEDFEKMPQMFPDIFFFFAILNLKVLKYCNY